MLRKTEELGVSREGETCTKWDRPCEKETEVQWKSHSGTGKIYYLFREEGLEDNETWSPSYPSESVSWREMLIGTQGNDRSRFEEPPSPILTKRVVTRCSLRISFHNWTRYVVYFYEWLIHLPTYLRRGLVFLTRLCSSQYLGLGQNQQDLTSRGLTPFPDLSPLPVFSILTRVLYQPSLFGSHGEGRTSTIRNRPFFSSFLLPVLWTRSELGQRLVDTYKSVQWKTKTVVISHSRDFSGDSMEGQHCENVEFYSMTLCWLISSFLRWSLPTLDIPLRVWRSLCPVGTRGWVVSLFLFVCLSRHHFGLSIFSGKY